MVAFEMQESLCIGRHQINEVLLERHRVMKRTGLTIIELLIVIAIVGVLIAVMVPAVRKQREAAGLELTKEKLKNLAQACYSCNAIHKKLPPAFGPFAKVTGTVHVHLLPFLDQDRLHKRWLNAAELIEGNVVPPFLAPLDFTQTNDGADGQNFLANLRVFSNAGFQLNFEGLKSGISWPTLAEAAAMSWPSPYWGEQIIGSVFSGTGTSHTIAFVTGYMNCGNKPSQRLYFHNPAQRGNSFFGVTTMTLPASEAGKGLAGTIFQLVPNQADCDRDIPQALTKKGICVAQFDGSVGLVSPSISPLNWAKAVQPYSWGDADW
jgi:prepilin-type N-terminal cleavage/methylation domain-containing protein